MSISKLVRKVKAGMNFIKVLGKDTEGASGIEYAVIAAMVAVILAGLSPTVSSKVSATFTAIAAAL